jgi:DNA repair protein RadC
MARTKPNAQSIDPPVYLVSTDVRADEDAVIARALEILSRRTRTGSCLHSPQDAKDQVRLAIGGEDREHFGVLFLDAQHRVIAWEVLFTGSLSQTSVYPREVVKAALMHNAGAVILAHNHPAGSTEPSRSDEHLTQTLKSALALVDVRVLDHFVVSTSGLTSFAERGLL